MKLDRGTLSIDFARELVEEALAAAARRADSELRKAFQKEKEAIHGIEIIDIREERLDALDSHWMERFHVSEPIESILARQPGVEDVISKCVLRLARSKAEEKAFLFATDSGVGQDDSERPMLVVHLMADTLLEPEGLEALVTTPLATARRRRTS